MCFTVGMRRWIPLITKRCTFLILHPEQQHMMHHMASTRQKRAIGSYTMPEPMSFTYTGKVEKKRGKSPHAWSRLHRHETRKERYWTRLRSLLLPPLRRPYYLPRSLLQGRQGLGGSLRLALRRAVSHHQQDIKSGCAGVEAMTMLFFQVDEI